MKIGHTFLTMLLYGFKEILYNCYKRFLRVKKSENSNNFPGAFICRNIFDFFGRTLVAGNN